jgi:ferritin
MLTEKMAKALNDQVNAEMYSGYLYLSMSAYFNDAGLDGFATWMEAQAMEELTHAKKIIDFIYQRGGRLVLGEIAAPPKEWDSPVAVFEETLKHEQKVTGLINALVDTALEERDHASNIFLQWFVTEQVEEEESVGAVLDELRLVADNKSGLFLINRELGARTLGGAEE